MEYALDRETAPKGCSSIGSDAGPDAPAAIGAVLQRYAPLDPRVDRTDGISADFGAWRFNLRSSNTEPLVRLNIESRANPGLVTERVGEISDILQGGI